MEKPIALNFHSNGLYQACLREMTAKGSGKVEKQQRVRQLRGEKPQNDTQNELNNWTNGSVVLRIDTWLVFEVRRRTFLIAAMQYEVAKNKMSPKLVGCACQNCR